MSQPQAIPCTEPGCPNVKFFPGRCNPCQGDWERKNLPSLPPGPYAGLSWIQECMTKVGARR